MKIKHPIEHDEIVQWILDNPDILLKNLGLNEPFIELKKKIQVNVKRNQTIVGIFDVQLQFECSENFIDPFEKSTSDNDLSPKQKSRYQFLNVNIIVNVKMESATEQLRELKRIYFQHQENIKKYNLYKQWYVIVSTNDKFKTFFTDNAFIFYKF